MVQALQCGNDALHQSLIRTVNPHLSAITPPAGLNSTSAFWKLQLEYFAALPEYQVCVFDNRGIGRSEAAAGSYSITTFAKDTLDLLDYLGWTQPVHVAGVSLGGMITQKLVLMAATRFISATFISTYHSAVFAMPTVGDVRYFLQSLTGPKDEITEHLLRLCFSKKWLSSPYNDRTSLTNRDMLMGAFNIIKTETPLSKAKQEADFNQLTATWWHNLTPWQIFKLKKSPTRILVMHGSKDKVIRSACGRALAMMLNCPFDLFEGSGHMIMIDTHEKFNRDLQAHLENRRGPPVSSGAETPDDLSDHLADEVYPTLADDSNAVPPPLTPPSEANLQSSVPWIPGSTSTDFRIPSPPTSGRVTKAGTFSTLFNRRGSDQGSEGPRPLNRPQTTVPNSPTYESNAAGQRAFH
ncbi:hypothetical protein IWQ60_005065 [Tieghemiomyces parasiticus]|uniref:AB hydrolase-1 domain-containing protein n=1 Tax=Tieghemiomyces parasiticus TaxID=78921 RepID=A0A9W8AEQ4_9FUNG|nr:hypothetical protein IWQ60_005065 [Tieghemiomyces parasiticus]